MIEVVTMEEVYIGLNNIHYSSRNHGARSHVYGRGGYRSHTSQSSDHNPGGCGILLVISFYSRHVKKNAHGDERGGYMYQISHSSSYNPCGNILLSGLSVA